MAGDLYNIYCDESGHLPNDQQKVMVLGAVWHPAAKAREVADRLRQLKVDHGLPREHELKSTKVSPAKFEYYRSVLDYFFDDDDLRFRALIVPDKGMLRHKKHKQTHDDWYYKMFYILLTWVVRPEDRYCTYLDIKDTRSAHKMRRLLEVLRNSEKDWEGLRIRTLQAVRSHEVEQIQLADLLIGLVSYANRGRHQSQAKLDLVSRMQQRSGYSLKRTTPIRSEKVNIIKWVSRDE